MPYFRIRNITHCNLEIYAWNFTSYNFPMMWENDAQKSHNSALLYFMIDQNDLANTFLLQKSSQTKKGNYTFSNSVKKRERKSKRVIRTALYLFLFASHYKLCVMFHNIQLNLNSSNTNGSFIMANSNSFLVPRRFFRQLKKTNI